MLQGLWVIMLKRGVGIEIRSDRAVGKFPPDTTFERIEQSLNLDSTHPKTNAAGLITCYVWKRGFEC
jgi:hypothetical protein